MNEQQIKVVTGWIADLRSGEYTQTRGALKRMDGSMCCLGVLSCTSPDVGTLPPTDEAIIRQMEIGVEALGLLSPPIVLVYGHNQAVGVPPKDWFTEKTGFDAYFMDELSRRNDGNFIMTNHKHTFADIADIIEKKMNDVCG